ncbi:SNARE domain containing protein/ putative syntaxin [Chrysochromulina ericina virus CeV-01B]|jgi:t-SNARE complex subunit (syntaxin)|uniref:SNARE domain containing protein/ putative syntaxin n=1 Tax=Chrysochromulina ericina virus CeV-01B TaxID=3070830 RepID=A0A0N7G7P0_9VIRU|nr:SNARE domain containing protein/ putative syntaxin [Chrysochromulina ericina virus]ALH23321.1 SNARE domain containing protein/ putative syntaxin [Chrysochromulina ericina virus CeV-01B]|tara:strand:- start:203 stop:508 length:306 start_codon:yes stop_codon:yes gene_type:complete
MQDQLIDIQLEEREQDINKLVNGVQEVSDLFTDVSLLVSYQGEQIENIQTNIQNSFSHINKANVDLEKAKKYKEKKRQFYSKLFCFIFFIISIIIIIIILK